MQRITWLVLCLVGVLLITPTPAYAHETGQVHIEPAAAIGFVAITLICGLLVFMIQDQYNDQVEAENDEDESIE